MFTVHQVAAQRVDFTDTLCSFHSQVLGEDRSYRLFVPASVKQSHGQFSILYLLDGERYFPAVGNMVELLHGSKISSLPPCVVVGLVSKDRTRDFTPWPSSAQRDGSDAGTDHLQGGGASVFARFMEDELMAQVEHQVGIPAQRMLMGHSYAALFTLYACTRGLRGVDTFMAVDPSLWWAKGEILKSMQETSHTVVNQQPVHLYVGFGTQPRTDQPLTQPQWVKKMEETVFPLLKAKGMEVIWREFPEENHGTIALPGFFDALKQCFYKQP